MSEQQQRIYRLAVAWLRAKAEHNDQHAAGLEMGGPECWALTDAEDDLEEELHALLGSEALCFTPGDGRVLLVMREGHRVLARWAPLVAAMEGGAAVSEQRVPYQAGEPAEKSLGRIAYLAMCQEFRDEGIAESIAPWEKVDTVAVEVYDAIAAAVEAEVLRRAVAYLEARRQATGDDPLVQQEYEHAAERVREYAEQLREG